MEFRLTWSRPVQWLSWLLIVTMITLLPRGAAEAAHTHSYNLQFTTQSGQDGISGGQAIQGAKVMITSCQVTSGGSTGQSACDSLLALPVNITSGSGSIQTVFDFDGSESTAFTLAMAIQITGQGPNSIDRGERITGANFTVTHSAGSSTNDGIVSASPNSFQLTSLYPTQSQPASTPSPAKSVPGATPAPAPASTDTTPGGKPAATPAPGSTEPTTQTSPGATPSPSASPSTNDANGKWCGFNRAKARVTESGKNGWLSYWTTLVSQFVGFGFLEETICAVVLIVSLLLGQIACFLAGTFIDPIFNKGNLTCQTVDFVGPTRDINGGSSPPAASPSASPTT